MKMVAGESTGSRRPPTGSSKFRISRSFLLVAWVIAGVLSLGDRLFVPTAQAQPSVTVGVLIERVTNKGVGDGVCGVQDFYAYVIIDGERKKTSIKSGDDIRPGWDIRKSVDPARGSSTISIELWEDDDFPCGSDDYIDISPSANKRLDLRVNLSTCSISGDISGECGTTLTSRGTAEDRAEIQFRVIMGACEQRGNILVCTGPGLYPGGSFDKTALMDLMMPPASPTFRGNVDFIIAYPLNADGTPLDVGDHSHEDMSLSPRPLRGIIGGDTVGLERERLTLDVIRGNLDLLGQEVGHHWLVPPDATVRGTPIRSSPDVIEAINDGRPVPDLPFIARQGSHWSIFIDGDASNMDGIPWRDDGVEDTLAIWSTMDTPPGGPTISTPLGSVRTNQRYSDLDLYIMGVLSAREAYPGERNSFRYMIPRIISPGKYHTGLVLAFDTNDMIYFGLYSDYRTLKVERTGGGPSRVSAVVQLDRTSYKPFASIQSGVLLRVVKRGNSYCLQAKAHSLYSLAGLRIYPTADSVFAGTDEPCPSVSTTGPFYDWKTIWTFSDTRMPKAVGFITKTWPDARIGDYVFSSFENLYLKDSGGQRTLLTDRIPPELTGVDYLSRVDNTLKYHIPNCRGGMRTDITVPAPCTKFKSVGGWLQVIVPLGPTVDHWTRVDNAPKVLTRAPSGDFAFGTLLYLNSVLIAPFAGGDALNRQMWGQVREVPVADFQVPSRLIPKQTPPSDNTYRAVFVLVAKERRHITDTLINNLDVVRRAFETYFREITTRIVAGVAKQRLMSTAIRSEWVPISAAGLASDQTNQATEVLPLTVERALFAPASRGGGEGWLYAQGNGITQIRVKLLNLAGTVVFESVAIVLLLPMARR